MHTNLPFLVVHHKSMRHVEFFYFAKVHMQVASGQSSVHIDKCRIDRVCIFFKCQKATLSQTATDQCDSLVTWSQYSCTSTQSSCVARNMVQCSISLYYIPQRRECEVWPMTVSMLDNVIPQIPNVSLCNQEFANPNTVPFFGWCSRDGRWEEVFVQEHAECYKI